MRLIKTTLFLLITAAGIAAPRVIQPGRITPTSFAIFVDHITFTKTESAIRAYQAAVEKDGLGTYILVDSWPNPEAVRQEIIRLYHSKPQLEGVVLVGDIPIPMIRDAQHLTSAFKMDQERYPFRRSSVPSDRFYDDFDLKFDFLKRDPEDTLLFYYSLRSDSPQRIEREIYSARIRPGVNDASRYLLIARYLERVARQKGKIGLLDTVFTFHGHGYHSEALNAWQEQTFALREQLPHLVTGGGRIYDLHHTMLPDVKQKVLAFLQNPTIDLAIFHAHGQYEAQLLTGYPPAEMLDQNVDAIKRFLSNRLREAQQRGRSLAELRERYQQQYHFPDAWFTDFMADSLVQADSLYAAMVDLYTEDIAGIRPLPKVVIFDECFNGGFINSPYMAGTYLFGEGEVIAAVANTVNVKQDIWADENLGLMALGVRIGSWHQQRVFLESHLFGDPTLHFQPLPEQRDFAEKWQTGKLKLAQELNHPLAIRRAWAVNRLFKQQGVQSAQQLVEIYRSDPAYNVRLEALKCLAALRTGEFEEILKVSIRDQFELIRRFSAQWMGLVGKQEYLQPLAECLLTDVSDRVRFVAKSSLEKISPELAGAAFQQVLSQMPATAYLQRVGAEMVISFKRVRNSVFQELLPEIKNDSLSLKKRIEAVRTLRNYQYQDALSVLLALSRDNQTPAALRVAILEALGWFNGSYNRHLIIAVTSEIYQDPANPEEVRKEALKTKQRILDGPNEPCG